MSPDPSTDAPSADAAAQDTSGKDPAASKSPAIVLQGSSDNSAAVSREATPPPLPPRPPYIDNLSQPKSSAGRPQLQAKATTALSLADVHTLSHRDAHKDPPSSPGSGTLSRQRSFNNNAKFASRDGSERDDSASLHSYVPTLEAGEEVESLLGEVLADQKSPAWRLLDAQLHEPNPYEEMLAEDGDFEAAFHREFDEIEEIRADGSNEESAMLEWRSKLKHFLILTSAGKPVYSRHGDDQLISNSVGIVQTIISFYQDVKDLLRSFTAGKVHFVVLSKGPLNLVAISRLDESDSQLRTQLEALYMQILSTLTLPNLQRMFSARPSTDLRRPLQGTETLLSALADGFTRGSPSTLLSALECLRIRKSHRQAINNILLKVRGPSLLYGLIVAGGRLVSVVRPKKHSLHPGDLQLIFNMLFEAGGVKAGGGENWIPLCLPGFNNTGYLYMYVSFLNLNDTHQDITERPSSATGSEDEVAILFISANKEGFFELRQMRDDLVAQLEKSGNMVNIKEAVKKGRPQCDDIIQGSSLRHFLYKSKGNVQFVMPSFAPSFTSPITRRRLLNTYHSLHSSVHAKNTHLKVHHVISPDYVALAWTTNVFELYCVAGPKTDRSVLAQAANKIIQWVRREEDRIFIIGGAVF